VRNSKGMICAGALLLAGLGTASATPVTYDFTTGNLVATPQPIPSVLAGATVQGSFVYDNDGPLLGTTPSGQSYNALSNLSGTVGGNAFGSVDGSVEVANNGYFFPPTGLKYDLLQLAAKPLYSTNPSGFTGFSIAGYDLVNVRLFWIDGPGSLGTTPDFLTSNDLPVTLLESTGRLALDFIPSGLGRPAVPADFSFVFFPGLTVKARPAAVPEPGPLVLLVLALGALATTLRRRPSALSTAD
jgi:hypothetical protein